MPAHAQRVSSLFAPDTGAPWRFEREGGRGGEKQGHSGGPRDTG